MAKQQKVEIKIPKAYSPIQRRAIAIEIVDYIKERTAKGKDKTGKDFPKYSPSYVKSLDFKIAGKSEGNVNLRLSSEMIDALDVVGDKPGAVVIGYERGDPINGKVEGNRIGSYGQSKGSRKKARDFLGIEPKALREILAKYPPKTDKAENRAERIVRSQERAEEEADE